MKFENKIKRAYKKTRNYSKVGRRFNISGWKVRHIVNYNPLLHKILTSAKRKILGLPTTNFPKDWNGGGRDWLRELVRIRDKHECQKCGKKWQEGNRRFDVHHTDEKMDGRSREKGTTKYDANNFDKLITICHKCHFNLDITKERISKKLSPLNPQNKLDSDIT